MENPWRAPGGAVKNPAHLFGGREVALAVEDEEGVDEVVVRVRVDAFELGHERHLEDGKLGQLALDQVRGRLVADGLALAGPVEDRIRERPAAVFGWIELVEVLTTLAAQHAAEAHARRVDVEKLGGRVARVPEGVHDVRRSGSERAGAAAHLRHLGAEAELDLAFEHVERVRVLPVHVWVRAFLAGLVAEPRDDDLREVAEDRDLPLGPIGGLLALARG